METITRNVSEIPAGDLQALEHLIGAPLRPSQQVIVKVVERVSSGNDVPAGCGEPQLPEWFNVYEGLSDEEIDRLDAAIQQRLDLTRDLDL
jgi:hypothetical protein